MESLDRLTATVAERGIRTTMDPRNVDPPGALVDLDRIGGDDLLCGRLTATATVYLIATDDDHPSALNTLLTMYDKVADLTTGAEAVTFALPDLPELPALKLSPIQLEE